MGTPVRFISGSAGTAAEKMEALREKTELALQSGRSM
jgi:hypothetical protein